MPTSSTGTMTPITGGVPGPVSAATPLPFTLLSLPRFAKMVGIAPVHFAGAVVAGVSPQVFPTGSSCGDVWPRYDWQNYDQVSHEGLAYAIKDAEESIAREVGYFPAPVWIAAEQKMYPRDFYRTSVYQTIDVRGFPKSVNTRYGRIISGGRRGVTLLGTPTTASGSLAYQDNDGDGFYETANIQLVGIPDTEICEIKVYFSGHDGEQEWEIRPERSKTLSGGALQMIFDSWLFIDPAILSAYPTDEGFQAVDITTVNNFVTDVEVYWEYVDTSLASAVFKWDNGTPGCICSVCGGAGCEVCADTVQDGCIQVRDPVAGIVAPSPATYSGGTWTLSEYDVCRAPDKLDLYYYAGERSNEFLRGVSCDPLSDFWAWCIIWLTIARLERPPCSCSRLKNMFDYLREDLAHNTPSGSYYMGLDLQTNPFGTHRGELMAWKRIKHHAGKRLAVAVI